MLTRLKLHRQFLNVGLAVLMLGVVAYGVMPSSAASSPLVGPDTNNNQHAYLDAATAKVQGAAYQIMKASQGTGFTDAYFAQGRKNAAASGLIPGAYHFLEKGNGVAQCDHYMSVINASGGPDGLLLAVDVELQNQTTGPSYQDVLDFLGHCQALTPGRTWIVYTAQWYWGAAHTTGHLGNPPAPAHTVLWIATYVSGNGNAFSLLNSVTPQGAAGEPYATNPINGWPDYAFRQYSDAGTIANLTGDVNVTYKGLDYVRSLAGLTGSPLPPSSPVKVGVVSTPSGKGYWEVANDGGVFTFGDGVFYGSLGAATLNAPIVGMAATPDGGGYWLAGQDGGVFTFGDAGFYGSRGSVALAAPIVGMASTVDGKGYWLVGSDGGIFSYGDAGFYGSAGSTKLNAPIVGMAATPDGGGYWLVGADGGIFAYGDAGFYGSAGGLALAAPIVGMASTVDGKGYWLASSDGGVFTFGDAVFYGSKGGGSGYVGITGTAAAGGYRLVNRDNSAPDFEPAIPPPSPSSPPPLSPPPPSDTTPPVITLNSPLSGTTVAGSIDIKLSASDNIAVSRVEFYVDAQLRGTNTEAPYDFTWNTINDSSGTHILMLKAYDAVGNVGTATSTVTVDNVPTLIPGDFNNDQSVNLRDFNVLLIHWHQTVTSSNDGDLNNDDQVDIRDLNQFLVDWGAFINANQGG